MAHLVEGKSASTVSCNRPAILVSSAVTLHLPTGEMVSPAGYLDSHGGSVMAKSVKLALSLLTFALLATWAVPAQALCGTSLTTTLFAGQTLDAGTVTVSNDALNISVTYTTNDP